MGDGEAGFMNYYINGIKPRWLSHNWLDYMCIRDHSDDNIKRIGKELIEVASDADFFGGNLWGLTNSAFDLWKFIERDKCNCSAFFPLEWYANGCMHSLLMTCSFGLLHKEPENIISSLEKKIGKDPRFHGKKIKPHKGIVMNGDFQEPEEFIKTTAYDVYLVSGGIQSKFWMHAMAKKYNKVILDIGHAMTRCWGRGY